MNFQRVILKKKQKITLLNYSDRKNAVSLLYYGLISTKDCGADCFYFIAATVNAGYIYRQSLVTDKQVKEI